MKLMKSLCSLLFVSLLAACGGGGGSGGTPIVGPAPTPTVNDLAVTLSSATVANTGAETVTVTVTALDANRNAVASVPVTIAANNNGVVTAAGTATNASGVLTATIGIGADRTNRTITITATAGTLSRTANLAVVQTGQQVTAADLVFVLSASSVANTGNETVTATVTALDANRNALPGAPVTITVDNNAVATASGTITDGSGRVTAAIGIGADRSNRIINVTARSGTISKTLPVQVTNAAANVVASDLVLALSSTTVSTSGAESVTATAIALDANRNAIAGIPVTLSVDSNAVATIGGAVTDASGRVTAAIGIGSDRSVRTITVTARTGSLVRTASLNVISGTPAPVAADLVLGLSSGTIANNGTQTITATATTLDARRNAIAGVPVQIAVDANAVATGAAERSDASGNVRATIGIGADRSNRTITITATSGALTRQTTLLVVDGTNPVPIAADLSLVLSATTLTNTGTGTITATATAVDANRNVIGGVPVTIRVDSNAVASVSAPVTNSSGVSTATVGIGADRTNRTVNVTAVSGSLVRTASFRVIGADLSVALAPSVVAGSVGNVVEYKLVDTNAFPMAGQAITVSAPGLPTATGVTDVNGRFAYTYNAPAASGLLNLTAQAAGDVENTVVTIRAATSGSVPNAIEPPLGASLATDPSVVNTNTPGSTSNQVELRALFVGQNNAPIQNMRVRFDLDGNTSSTDGNVAWLGGTYAYTDANGVARGTFVPGQRTSPTLGVTIRACYATNDFQPDQCPNAVRTKLTVVNEPLSVAIGSTGLIGGDTLTYSQQFPILVVDAAGQPKRDVLVTASIDLSGYRKGFWVYNAAAQRWNQTLSLRSDQFYGWSGSSWNLVPTPSATSIPTCPNEDANRNSVREAMSPVAGTLPVQADRREDLNWNGDLDPRKADVAILVLGNGRTDANGRAVIQIVYLKSSASWVDYVITVTALGIGGSEARAKYSGTLEVPVSDVTSAGTPAFVVSPYGISDVCTDAK